MPRIMRKARVGCEIELFLLNDEGRPVNDADTLLAKLKDERIGVDVRPEISRAMLEIGSKPHATVREMARPFLDRLERVLDACERHGYRLLPLGSYPGKAHPLLHTTPWYHAKKAVLGKENVTKEAGICGYHFHYTLPERIVHEQQIRVMRRSHAQDTFLNQYNFLVAADPAMLTFCQSSPFWQGEQYAKDCRVLIYRDFALHGEEGVRGIHYYLPLFGALSGYEFTLGDLRVTAERRKSEWIKLLQRQRFGDIVHIVGVPALKFMWGPLRVNKIGTFEYRGPDMNHPTYILAVAALLRYALDAIEAEGLEMRPTDLGAAEPFLLEDGIVHLPPYHRLRYLEYLATVKGLESQEVHIYCKRLVRWIAHISKKASSPFLQQIWKMLGTRKTMADEILDLARQNGYTYGETLPEDVASYVALYHTQRLRKEINEARRLCERMG